MNSEQYWISSENNWFSLRSFLKNTEPALNITDFFWSSHEHCCRRDFTCSPKNTKKIEINSCNNFFPICSVYFSIFHRFCSSYNSSDMESKGNTDFQKITLLEFFRRIQWKLFWNFRFLVFPATRMKKKHFFGCFHGLCLFAACEWWSVLNQSCSEMFTELVSYHQRCQN